MEAVDVAERTSAPRLLLQRNVGIYFVGNLLSNCGTWFQNLAQAILIWRLTHSTLLVGAVNFAQFAGSFFLASWAGAAADRFDRRRLLALTQVAALVMALTMAALVGSGSATAPAVIALAAGMGLTIAFAIPALQALVPLLVEPHDLSGAVALNSVTFNLARAIGPVLATVVIHSAGLAWAFVINGVSFIALITALALIRPRPQQPSHGRPKLRDSIAIVRADIRLVALFGAVAAVSLSIDPVTTLTPAFASQIFHQSDTIAGVLVGMYGVGAILALVRLPREVGYARLAGALLLMSAGLALFSVSTALVVGLGAMLVVGVGYLWTAVGATTEIHLAVDDTHRGRVMALWSVAFLGLRPFGALADGFLGDTIGIRGAAVAMAAPAVITAGALLVLARRRGASARAGRTPA